MKSIKKNGCYLYSKKSNSLFEMVKRDINFLARRCEPYKSPWNKRDKSVFYLVWCKPVKCMQTTLLLSAADQLLNKLGGVKEL